MMALTVYQPWASLIMIGAKPVEFRKWDFTERRDTKHLVGKRIVIHAGKRPVKPSEIEDLISRCEADDTSLIAEKALPLLYRLRDASKCRGVVELSAALGTAIIGRPRRVDRLFQTPDSDRVDHHMYGWPLSEIQPWVPPQPCNGAQGFWPWTAPSQRAAVAPDILASG